jgi:hypothetical protein
MKVAAAVPQETVFEAGDGCALTSALILASMSDFSTHRFASKVGSIEL